MPLAQVSSIIIEILQIFMYFTVASNRDINFWHEPTKINTNLCLWIHGYICEIMSFKIPHAML